MSGYFVEDDFDLQDEYDSLQEDYYRAHRRLYELHKVLETIDTDYKVDSNHPGYHLIPTETFLKLVELGMDND
jgi:hypothetical protein